MLDFRTDRVDIDRPHDDLAEVVAARHGPACLVGFEEEREQVGDRRVVKIRSPSN